MRAREKQRLRLHLRPVHRQVPRRIPRAFLAFVARVVLLVHHDQAQPGQAGKHGHARAQHNARGAGVCGQPAVQSLRRRHAAVQAHHRVRAIQRLKALPKARLQLRRQVDLGHHHQHLGGAAALGCGGVQHLAGGAQIHLGFATAGGAIQQHRRLGAVQRGQRLALFVAQVVAVARGVRLGCAGMGCSRWAGLGPALEPARQLLVAQLAQLWRQRGHGHLAQAALVILCGKFHQLAPARVQRRHTFQHARHRLGLGFGQALGWLGGAFPHHAQPLAFAQRHAHQRARRKQQLTSVAQAGTHPAVGWGGHHHVGPKGHG